MLETIEDLECCTGLADRPGFHIGKVPDSGPSACDRRMDPLRVRPPWLALV